jgi:hypothetical protein
MNTIWKETVELLTFVCLLDAGVNVRFHLYLLGYIIRLILGMKWRLETNRKFINGLFQLSTIVRNCSSISFVGEKTSSPLARRPLLSKFVDILQHPGTTFECQ